MASQSNVGDDAVFGYANTNTSQSPPEIRNCFCGNVIRDGEGIYCSAGCARSDAFSTLCNKPNPPSLASSIALGSSTINANTNSDSYADATRDAEENDWESTHYGRMCRADLRREERKEERRRRRAEGSVGGSTSSRSTFMSTASSTSASRVPDLVGGHPHYAHNSHSRNPSVASSRTSYSSNGGLSRNPSVASSSSASRRGYGFNVDTPIMEDDDEAEWLASDPTTTNEYGLPHPYGLSMPPSIRMPIPTIRGQPHPAFGNPLSHPGGSKRRPTHSQSSFRSQKKRIEPFGMGQDMRDVLEEIIQMEKEFIIDGSSDEASLHGYQSDHQQPEAVFTAVFDRPPRTPSPGPLEGKKRISLAPNAPERGHRKSMSMANKPQVVPQPPPFTYGHSASLSESHTALYMATASPETENRSASPARMKARNSMTFTPEAAGPVISGGPSWLTSDLTPSRRRPGQSHSPSTHHPTISGWRFPAYNGTSTPTKLSIDTQAFRTPTSSSQRPHPNTRQLLWPPNAGLAPSHFPSSAGSRGSIISINMDGGGTGTPSRSTEVDNSLISSPTVQGQVQAQAQVQSQRQAQGQRRQRQRQAPREVTPPNSGLRLGVLLGSSGGGGPEEGMDLDDHQAHSAVDADPMSTIGHAFEYGFGSGRGMGRPVYLAPSPVSESVPRFG